MYVAPTLESLLAARAASPAPFLVTDPEGPALSYAWLTAAVGDWSAAFDRAGLGAGARLALVLAPGPAWTAAYLAALGRGLLTAALDPAAAPAVLREWLRRFQPQLVVAQPGAPVGRSWPQVTLAPTALLPPSLPPRLPAGGGEEGVLVCADPEGPWRPVRLSASQLLYVAARIARHLHLGPDDTAWTGYPLTGLEGQVTGLLATLVAGGTLVLGPWRRLAVLRPAPTWANLPPAMVEAGPVLAGLRLVRVPWRPGEGRPAPEWEARWGCPVLTAYDVPEAGGQVSAEAPPPAPRRAGSVGRPLGVAVSVHDADGWDLPPGEEGEVWVNGPSVIRAYWGQTYARRFRQGWFRTGDRGYLDTDGYLYLTGRLGADLPAWLRRAQPVLEPVRGAPPRPGMVPG